MPHLPVLVTASSAFLCSNIVHNLCNSLLPDVPDAGKPLTESANSGFVLHHARSKTRCKPTWFHAQAAQDYRVDPYLRDACQADIEAHCSGTKPERGGVQQCLVCSLHICSLPTWCAHCILLTACLLCTLHVCHAHRMSAMLTASPHFFLHVYGVLHCMHAMDIACLLCTLLVCYIHCMSAMLTACLPRTPHVLGMSAIFSACRPCASHCLLCPPHVCYIHCNSDVLTACPWRAALPVIWCQPGPVSIDCMACCTACNVVSSRASFHHD